MGDDKWASMVGDIETEGDVDALTSRLQALGLYAQIRESAQFEGGRYILVSGDGAEFTLKRTGPGEFLVQGEGKNLSRMSTAATKLSAVLRAMDIRHGFEICDGRGQVRGYVHHLWPQADV